MARGAVFFFCALIAVLGVCNTSGLAVSEVDLTFLSAGTAPSAASAHVYCRKTAGSIVPAVTDKKTALTGDGIVTDDDGFKHRNFSTTALAFPTGCNSTTALVRFISDGKHCHDTVNGHVFFSPIEIQAGINLVCRNDTTRIVVGTTQATESKFSWTCPDGSAHGYVNSDSDGLFSAIVPSDCQVIFSYNSFSAGHMGDIKQCNGMPVGAGTSIAHVNITCTNVPPPRVPYLPISFGQNANNAYENIRTDYRSRTPTTLPDYWSSWKNKRTQYLPMGNILQVPLPLYDRYCVKMKMIFPTNNKNTFKMRLPAETLTFGAYNVTDGTTTSAWRSPSSTSVMDLSIDIQRHTRVVKAGTTTVAEYTTNRTMANSLVTSLLYYSPTEIYSTTNATLYVSHISVWGHACNANADQAAHETVAAEIAEVYSVQTDDYMALDRFKEVLDRGPLGARVFSGLLEGSLTGGSGSAHLTKDIGDSIDGVVITAGSSPVQYFVYESATSLISDVSVTLSPAADAMRDGKKAYLAIHAGDAIIAAGVVPSDNSTLLLTVDEQFYEFIFRDNSAWLIVDMVAHAMNAVQTLNGITFHPSPDEFSCAVDLLESVEIIGARARMVAEDVPKCGNNCGSDEMREAADLELVSAVAGTPEHLSREQMTHEECFSYYDPRTGRGIIIHEACNSMARRTALFHSSANGVYKTVNRTLIMTGSTKFDNLIETAHNGTQGALDTVATEIATAAREIVTTVTENWILNSVKASCPNPSAVLYLFNARTTGVNSGISHTLATGTKVSVTRRSASLSCCFKPDTTIVCDTTCDTDLTVAEKKALTAALGDNTVSYTLVLTTPQASALSHAHGAIMFGSLQYGGWKLSSIDSSNLDVSGLTAHLGATYHPHDENNSTERTAGIVFGSCMLVVFVVVVGFLLYSILRKNRRI